MSVLSIITAPDLRLKQKSLPVNVIDDSTRKLVNDMIKTMYHNHGVGLAAIQIGIAKRMLVVDLQDNNTKKAYFCPLFIADPKIIKKSQELSVAVEGCLSLPGQQINVVRYKYISIKFLDYNNSQQELKAEDWLARVIQHEMDHLDGRLLVDYLSDIKKDVALRKLKKLKNNIL